MNPQDPSPSRPTRARATRYSSLGQFRVVPVSDHIPSYRTAADTPEIVAELWHSLVTTSSWFDPEKEHVVVFVLTTRLMVKGWNLVSVGSVNETTCHPREIFRPVVVAAGYGFVVVHNHPSGDPSPSQADTSLTRRLVECSELLQLKFLDHVVVGTPGKYFSFREAGMV
jgi:DNA repair protein RadC